MHSNKNPLPEICHTDLLNFSKQQAHVLHELKENQKKKNLLDDTQAEVKYTQTEGYLKLILGPDYHPFNLEHNISVFLKKQDQFYSERHSKSKSMTRNAQSQELINVLLAIINEEKKHHDHYVFYHGANSRISFLYHVYSQVSAQLLQEVPRLNRLRPFNTPFLGFNSVHEFIHYIDHKQGSVYNYREGYTDLGLNANVSLMGNWHFPGSSTIRYWLENYSEQPPNIEQILFNYFCQLGFPQKEAEDEANLYLSFLNQRQRLNDSELLQIFIHKSAVDQLTYISETLGDPLKIDFGDGESTSYSPAKLLALMQSDPIKLENLLRKNKKNFHNQSHRPSFVKLDPEKCIDLRQSNTFCVSTILEARMFLGSLFNSEQVIIKTYHRHPQKVTPIEKPLSALVTQTLIKLFQFKKTPSPAFMLSKKFPLDIMLDSHHKYAMTDVLLVHKKNILEYIINGENEEIWDSKTETYKRKPWFKLNSILPKSRFSTVEIPIQMSEQVTTTLLRMLIFVKAKDKLMEIWKNVYEKERFTALYDAICYVKVNKNTDFIIELLKKLPFDANANLTGITLLHAAVHEGEVEIVRQLLKIHHIDVNCKMKEASVIKSFQVYSTPLLLAINGNHLEILQLLLDHPNIEINDTEAGSGMIDPMTFAIMDNNIAAVKLLLNCEKLKVPSRLWLENDDRSAMHIAIKENNIPILSLLLGHPDIKLHGFLCDNPILTAYLYSKPALALLLTHPKFELDLKENLHQLSLKTIYQAGYQYAALRLIKKYLQSYYKQTQQRFKLFYRADEVNALQAFLAAWPLLIKSKQINDFHEFEKSTLFIRYKNFFINNRDEEVSKIYHFYKSM